MTWTEPSPTCDCGGTGEDGCEPDPTAEVMAGLSRLCQAIAADMAGWRGLLANVRHDALRSQLSTGQMQVPDRGRDTTPRGLLAYSPPFDGAIGDFLRKETDA